MRPGILKSGRAHGGALDLVRFSSTVIMFD